MSDASQAGFQVELIHAAKFDGKTLSDEPGWKATKGECATGVQYVFFKAGKPLGQTMTWKEGARVKGNSVSPGTAIASFVNGRYANKHAAILIKETSEGLEVWDQYNTPHKPWGKRLLPFKGTKTDYSNDGDLFSVIKK